MLTLTLLVDNREDDQLQKMISESGLFTKIPFKSKQLGVGDFVFANGDSPVFIIERKTIADLASSVKSKTGRYREQKHRLCNDTGLPPDRIMYLIEGYQNVCNEDTICGLPKSTILSCFVNTIARDKLHVYHTKDKFETCVFLSKLYTALATLSPGAGADYIDVNRLGIKKDKLTPPVVYQLQLTIVPGISTTMAKEISKVYQSFPDLITAWAKSETPGSLLEDIIVNGKRLGIVRSQRIFDFFFNKK